LAKGAKQDNTRAYKISKVITHSDILNQLSGEIPMQKSAEAESNEEYSGTVISEQEEPTFEQKISRRTMPHPRCQQSIFQPSAENKEKKDPLT
jgi:hypothetical protein